MSNDVTLVMGDQSDDEQFVQVPIKKKDFGDFITNLLGQPEVIRDKKIGSYEASFEWLVHVHHLLDQRIKQQSRATLVDFSALFNYRDAPERKLSSIDAFLAFNEAKIVTTKGVKLTWTYLVEFPNKPTPEKQEISLTLLTDRTEVVHLGGTKVLRQTTNENGIAAYSISHTQRTWGDDIQNLLDKEIDSIFKKETKLEKFLSRTVVLVALAFFTAGLVVPDYIENLILERQLAVLFADYVKDGITLTDLSVADKLSLVLEIVNPSNNISTTSGWYKGLSFIGGLALGMFTLYIFDRDKPSYITVTNEDKNFKDKCNTSSKTQFIKKLVSFGFAVATGVAANYVYLYLSS
ncbi:hypothetical protein VCSRO60_3549 [Vibrio cholerae]|nr:hypothetical protein VCSRO60_3549 [Vibrio cholerae]